MTLNVEKIIENLFKSAQLPTEQEIWHLCMLARELLCEEGNVQRLSSPITVCGDIHGQFFDVLELFKIGGRPPETCYLFMGDFVDRGFHSIETFLTLITLKVKYPNHIALIRGNHESRQITQIYGFYDECLRKFGNSNVWRWCCDLFDYIGLTAVIDGSIFAVHGGLSPLVRTLDQIRIIDRKREVPHDGAMCDLLWSDPDENVEEWGLSPRGAGFLFGKRPLEVFMHTNNLQMMTRAHQLVMEGYKLMFDDQLATVWSAPNYCYRCANVASIMEVGDSNAQPNFEFRLFEAASGEDGNGPVGASTNKKMPSEYFL